MGRSKEYDRTDLTDRAVELFRRQGFNGTSTAELVSELGVNRKTMYAEFGSKQGLFEATLERYGSNHLSTVLAPLESPGAGPEAIQQAFMSYASASEGPFRGQGCLLCNTAVERGALDTAIGRHVDAYFHRLTAAFRHALSNGQDAGEIDPEADLDQLAEFFATLLVGVAASIRGQAPARQLHATSKIVADMLDNLRPRRS